MDDRIELDQVHLDIDLAPNSPNDNLRNQQADQAEVDDDQTWN